MAVFEATNVVHAAQSAPLPVRTSVVVIGGGPAGGFTALELAQNGCDVLLVESQTAPRWKIGETLPPEARIHLQRLQYWDCLASQNHLPCHGIVSVWDSAEPVEKDFIFNPHGHGWQLDRERFERELLSAVANAGGQVALGLTVERIERESDGWLLVTDQGHVSARWLVDCSGRRGVVVRNVGGAYEQLDELVSVCAIAQSSQGTDGDARTFVEALPGGWCYSALMPNRTRIIACQADRDALDGGQADHAWLKQQLTAASTIGSLFKKHDYQWTRPVKVVAAHSGRFAHCAGEDWVAVGDAAMTFDPLSGQGTAKSLESAYRAVRLILHGEDYQAACERLWNQFVAQRLEFYGAERRWTGEPFWSRRTVPPPTLLSQGRGRQSP